MALTTDPYPSPLPLTLTLTPPPIPQEEDEFKLILVGGVLGMAVGIFQFVYVFST